MRDPVRKAILQTVGLGVVLTAALFVSAGTLAWPMAWAVVSFYAAFSVTGFLLLPPDLIAERSSLAGGEPADLVVAGLAFLFLLPISFAACGLDARLQGSPAIPPGVRIAAFAVFVLGYGVSLWAASSNPFFSGVVRVQRERGHRVASGGPYAFVRHPGYAGPMAGHLLLPLALGSLWGIVPAALGCACLVIRIGSEERVLREELAGYTEYAQRVRWRLVPGLW
jgi:protein-S-isoprenylcysteine O-methyltransferase Ste14